LKGVIVRLLIILSQEAQVEVLGKPGELLFDELCSVKHTDYSLEHILVYLAKRRMGESTCLDEAELERCARGFFTGTVVYPLPVLSCHS
jgi:hypothetical protein